MVDELILVQVPSYDILLSGSWLESLYATGVSLSQSRSLTNYLMNNLQLFQIDEVTLLFGVGLMIQGGPQVVAARKSSPPLPIDLKGKQARSPSLWKRAKKIKGLSHPSNFTPGPDEASTTRAAMDGGAPQDLAGTTPSGTSKALKMEERGLATSIETQTEISRAQVSTVESPRWMTRATMKAKATVAKVK